MTQAIRRYFDPLIAMNRRVSIGGGVLALILLERFLPDVSRGGFTGVR